MKVFTPFLLSWICHFWIYQNLNKITRVLKIFIRFKQHKPTRTNVEDLQSHKKALVVQGLTPARKFLTQSIIVAWHLGPAKSCITSLLCTASKHLSQACSCSRQRPLWGGGGRVRCRRSCGREGERKTGRGKER